METPSILIAGNDKYVRAGDLREAIDYLLNNEDRADAFNKPFSDIAQTIIMRGLYADRPEATAENANMLYSVLPSPSPDPTTDNTLWISTGSTWVMCLVNTGALASPGADTQVIFNQGGALSASANFIFDYTNKYLGIGGTPSANVHAVSAGTANIMVESTGVTATDDAHVRMKVSGTSGGDPHLQFSIAGGTSWTAGVDNSDSDAFVISASATLGTSNAFKINTAGNITTGDWRATKIDIAYGGTNATTAAGARVNLLPSLTGNTLKVLRVNAGETDVEWATAGGGVSDADYGDITVSGSGATWTIDNNAVSFAKMQQVTGLSVVGVTGTSTSNVAAITGTANQVLIVNGAGTSLAFGQVNLSSPSAVSGTLAAGKGGTGNNTYAVGDLLYASGATALSKLADVSVGSYLRSGGVTTAPLWSTLKLPNTATQYYVPYPATANNYNESSNFQFDGTNLSVGGASSGHRVNIIAGSLADQKNALKITATLAGTGTNDQVASYWTVTTAGTSSTLAQIGMRIDMAAGYTGTHYSAAFVTVNSVAGTGTSITGAKANFGFSTNASATTTGYNIGLRGNVGNGNLNVGAYGSALIAKNSATNIGVLGLALNTGTSPIQVAGFFGLQNSDPTFASAALMCDNGSQTSDIFAARDNGTTKFKITDAGNVVCSNAALATNATDGFLYIPTCAGTPTGVPTAQTGTVAMVFDTTNNKLYIYDGGWLGGTTPGAFV